MSYQDHLKTCSYCSGIKDPQKPTIKIKGASSYRRERKLSELMSVIKGVSYPGISYVGNANSRTKTKGASESEVVAARKPGPIEREVKLRELGRLIRGT